MRTMRTHGTTAGQLVCGVTLAALVSLVVIVSASGDDSALGAPPVWPWLLTGFQVIALWSAGRGRWWAWLLGASIQLPWIAYAVATDQIGFIPGCLVSSAVQTYNFLRNAARNTPMEVMT